MGLTFDFFNTIIEPKDKNVSKRAFKAVHDVAVKHGLTIDFTEFLNKVSSHWEKVLKKRIDEGTETSYNSNLIEIFTELGIQLSETSEVIRETTDAYFRILNAGVQLVEGALEVLENLSKKYKLGLISNFTYPPFIRTQLEQHNLSDFFEVITISGDHGFTKPFPRIFNVTLANMNMKPNKVIHIGDSLICDVIGAKKAGLKAIWFKRNDEQKSEGKYRPDLTILQLLELLEVELDSLRNK
ncbi:MAG: HAD family hydrolase [Candidatus Sifarchaeia archaeon]|jgi:putative hydrolase of the HAD superfamily